MDRLGDAPGVCSIMCSSFYAGSCPGCVTWELEPGTQLKKKGTQRSALTSLSWASCSSGEML